MIITINRECGSGGGTIARRLGEKLGIKVYGRAMLAEVAKQFDLTLEGLDKIKAQKTSWWDDFCRFYQKFGAASYTPSTQPEATPLSIYYAEARLLRELAEQESCIIIGRAGFHIFRDDPNALHMLIMADLDVRVARIANKQHLSTEEATNLIARIDKDRDTFVKNVADISRYDARNYDLVFNVTGMPTDSVVSLLAEHIQCKFESRQ